MTKAAVDPLFEIPESCENGSSNSVAYYLLMSDRYAKKIKQKKFWHHFWSSSSDKCEFQTVISGSLWFCVLDDAENFSPNCFKSIDYDNVQLQCAIVDLQLISDKQFNHFCQIKLEDRLESYLHMQELEEVKWMKRHSSAIIPVKPQILKLMDKQINFSDYENLEVSINVCENGVELSGTENEILEAETVIKNNVINKACTEQFQITNLSASTATKLQEDGNLFQVFLEGLQSSKARKCVIEWGDGRKSSTISVHKGDLTKFKADVLVNTVAGDGTKLCSAGAVSKAFSQVIGNTLQTEFNQNYSSAFRKGNAIVTSAGSSLRAKCVYHVHLAEYRSWRSIEDLNQNMESIFEQLRAHGFTSIAFPTVGCGQLGYPTDKVVECFQKVAKKYPGFQINIVAFETKIYNIFWDEFKSFNSRNTDINLTIYTLGKKTMVDVKKMLTEWVEKYCPPEVPGVSKSGGSSLSIYPSYWKAQDSYQNGAGTLLSSLQPQQSIRVPLELRSDVHASAVQKIFEKTWLSQNNTQVRVKNIWRIENRKLFEKYHMKVKEIQARAAETKFPLITDIMTRGASSRLDSSLDTELNEFYLFHGTKKEKVEAIIHQGFDFRLSNESGLFGSGIYMAESSVKSDNYVDSVGRRVSVWMFVARVVLGHGYETAPRKFRRPPCTSSGCLSETCTVPHQFHDSVIGKHSNARDGLRREFIVYDCSQCYPEFLIEYERQ